MKTTENGWIILSEDGKIIYDFTFSRTRIEAQKKWVRIWDKPNNWKSHYRKGVRCIKAKMTITTNL